MTERIRLTDVTKQFPGAKGADPQLALQDVSLSIEAGEIYGLIGQSGAGKSTLLRMIDGLERPTSGTIAVDGTDLAGLRPDEMRALRRSIGMVFQQFSLWNARTVYDNIAVPLKLAGWSKEAINARVAELIDFVGLHGKAFAKPRQLSGGQKQRVGIARAIATRPSIVLADEATSALDPQTTTEIIDLLRAANTEFGITMVVVTHEMDVIARLADRLSILSRGQVVETGEVHQVLSRPEHPVSAGLVGSYTRMTLSEEDRRELREGFAGTGISVVVQESLLRSPVLSRLARQHDVDFTVITGGISRTKGLPYGQLSLALYGEGQDVDAFVAGLRQHAEVSTW
ncbi:methionine ABC transporter ATP-binding protein [Ornithinicoccus hortensis]|uniref:D-methionine transport system ATP-binding protein n=1 Tax=Ornithinicoccus hortensis TaxID=82346 RepID=A0A542YVJ2_9MICO|nr:methionine ABC transporter ATP-binding protein [Ornithinicoccus hortensis]TQL52105.1 D-methionine transport system ATP-binding protein [Ornithinicoccus hortensis]